MSATSEAGAAPGGTLEQQLLGLRELVFHRSPGAAQSARELEHDVALMAARVELMTALADSNNGVDGSPLRVEQAAARLDALAPAGPETIVELTAALFVADRESEALARILGLMDTSNDDVDHGQIMMLVEYLFSCGRARQAEKLLQRTLRHPGAGIPGLLSTTAGTVLRGRKAIITPASRRLLEQLLGLVDWQLLAEPGNPALLRIRARSLIDLGRYQDALEAVDPILASDKSDASARWLRVVILTRLADYQTALQDFDLLSLERASTPWALAIRIHLLYHLGQYSRALEVGAEALEQFPSHPDVRLAYALAVEAAGQPERALELITELLRDYPDDAELLTVEGALLRRLGRLPEATEALQRAVEKNPHDVDARASLADMLANGERMEEAISHLDVAISDDPDRVDLLLQRSRILLRVDRTIEALECVDLALGQDTGSAEMLALRADILARLGRQEEAAAWYWRAYQQAGGPTDSAAEPYAMAIEEIATAMFTQSTHFAEALDCLKPLTKAGVLSPAGMGLRAELLRLTGRFTQSLKQADMAIAAGSDYVWTSGTKGQVLVDLSRSQEAIDLLDDVLERDPDYVWSRFTAISALDEVGRASDALAALDRYFPEGKSPAGWETASQMTRARFLVDLGRYDDVTSKLEQADEAGLNEAERAYLHGALGVIRNRRRHFSEAADDLRTSIGLLSDEIPAWIRLELADASARCAGRLTDEATSMYQAVAAMTPPELVPRERANRAWAHFRLGQLDVAIADYLAAFAAATDPLAEWRFRFAVLLHAAARPEADMEQERAQMLTAGLPDRVQAREVVHEAVYSLDLLVHDEAHAVAADRLEHVRAHLAEWDRDVLAHNNAGTRG